MELDVERHERIVTPLQLVWEEKDSLEQILAKSPQASSAREWPMTVDVAVATQLTGFEGIQKTYGHGPLAGHPLRCADDRHA